MVSKERREKIATVGEEIVKDKPGTKPMWDMLAGFGKEGLELLDRTTSFPAHVDRLDRPIFNQEKAAIDLDNLAVDELRCVSEHMIAVPAMSSVC